MKEFWNGHLFLIMLLRAQENEFNPTVLCIGRGGVYNVHQLRVGEGGGGVGGGVERLPIVALFLQKGKRTRRGNKTWPLFFVSFPIRRLPAGWIFNLVPRVLSDRNPESKKGQLLIHLYSYSRTFTNRHLSTTTTFFCPQGGHCGEVQL